MLRSVNRILLGLAGALLIACGAAVLVGALSLKHHWGLPLPSWWPYQDPHDVLLPAGTRRRWRHEEWWWPAVLAALAAVALLAVWWLLAQLRRRRTTDVLVDCGDGEAAVVRGRALEEALSAEAESLEGVDRALVALRGRRTAPEARVALRLSPHASPSEALRLLDAEVLAHARASAGLDALPAEVRLTALRHRAERVE
ncbi:alkaline shock response membrane anchor protein AmaP [Streptomyces gamaensis]|uniref:Alkaline shock response membrane anchor protein AmaP n=1 Tax=Streptomyces gamaensis TaxID=1763542 RepID=A0ABW0Z2Y7_9ACTN